MVGSPTTRYGRATATDEEFLVREGLELLAAYKAVRSVAARKAILAMVAAVVQAERDAADAPPDG